MATFYMWDYGKWIELPDDTNLRDWARWRLKQEAYRDSDGGWSTTIEFWKDGVRTYAYAYFNGWMGSPHDGAMSDFDYGTAQHIFKQYDVKVRPYRYAPDRDWLLIGSRHAWG